MPDDNLNSTQIIRKDARGCFVEAKSDAFDIGKVHLEFAAYDATKPVGQRQTNHIHIYIDVADFLVLTQEIVSGAMLAKVQNQRAAKDQKPLYKCLGGTSAKRLTQYGRARADGKSLSRIVKLLWGERVDYLFIADSGPGEEDAKGLIVPRFGNKPENHVSVGMTHRNLCELLLTAKVHYEAWLASWYAQNQSTKQPQRSTPSMPLEPPKRSTPSMPPEPAKPSSRPPQSNSGRVDGNIPVKKAADDMQSFF